MLGFEEIICCGRDYHEEEKHSPNKTDLFTNTTDCCVHPLLAYHPYAGSYFLPEFLYLGAPVPVGNPIISTVGSQYHRDVSSRATVLDVLEALATDILARHVTGVVHGNLTPESVIVRGRGVLINEGCSSDCQLSRTRAAPDDDVYGARWAGTEFFRLDNGNPCPTKMSDVYSFACLMLQMLTGRVPYCGTKRPEQVVYLKYLGREPIDAQTPKIADRYVAFMRWCWSPEPEKRPTMETVVGFIREEIKRLGE